MCATGAKTVAIGVNRCATAVKIGVIDAVLRSANRCPAGNETGGARESAPPRSAGEALGSARRAPLAVLWLLISQRGQPARGRKCGRGDMHHLRRDWNAKSGT